jgi:hypothetical protein
VMTNFGVFLKINVMIPILQKLVLKTANFFAKFLAKIIFKIGPWDRFCDFVIIN